MGAFAGSTCRFNGRQVRGDVAGAASQIVGGAPSQPVFQVTLFHKSNI
jgi:hypothetical protein